MKRCNGRGAPFPWLGALGLDMAEFISTCPGYGCPYFDTMDASATDENVSPVTYTAPNMASERSARPRPTSANKVEVFASAPNVTVAEHRPNVRPTSPHWQAEDWEILQMSTVYRNSLRRAERRSRTRSWRHITVSNFSGEYCIFELRCGFQLKCSVSFCSLGLG